MTRQTPISWLCDMDGVLVREGVMVPGADRFVKALLHGGRSFLVLTNNSMYTRRDLSARLNFGGLNVPEDHIWTSALATAGFLAAQRPGGSAFVIGEVDRRTGLLRKETVRVIDDRGPNETPQLQLSNFAAREDRETGEIVLHLCRFFEHTTGAERDWTSDAYVYHIPVK